MAFNFTLLPEELQLRVTELIEPSSVMALGRTSHSVKKLIDQNRVSVIKGILDNQYPEYRMVLGQMGPRMSILEDGKAATIDDLLGVTSWEQRIGHIQLPGPRTVEEDEVANAGEGYFVEMAIWACRKVAATWRNWSFLAWSYDVQSTRWGYLVLVRMIRAIIDKDIDILETRQFISRSVEYSSHFHLMSACDLSFATSRVESYAIHDVRCALLLLWRLRWRYGHDGQLRTGDTERIRLVEMAPQRTQEIFQVLLRKLVGHNGFALPYYQLLNRCDAAYYDRDDISASERRYRKREVVCIRRGTESLILQALLEQGLNALEVLETYTENDIRLLPEDGLDQIISPWVRDEFRRTEQESQAEWDEHPYVKMGLLDCVL